MNTEPVEARHRVRLAHLTDDLDASLAGLRDDPGPVRRARAVVEDALASDEAHYGINTGFGALARERIVPGRLKELQRNLLLSHAVGMGDPVPPPIARLMLRLKIHALGLGHSGVSMATFERLLAFAERGLTPVVPSRGSVGASGDLAPLAHLALPLIGEGQFWSDDGTAPRPAQEVLADEGLAPVELQPKDGLALINGTQQMAAYGAFVLRRARDLTRLADLLATMSLEALRGSARPFDARVQDVRPQQGQAEVARNVRLLLTESEILESHRHCGKVQDPYCLRCVPQVHGASRHALAHATGVVETEINAVSDNPLVFENGDIVSAGNFHGQPLALALDYAAMALSELASISERRTYLLLEGHDGLPKLLMEDTGLNSGFMIPQYTAAALVSENKVLSHPASVDSIPTSLGQEDHVSMGSISALKLLDVLKNTERVLTVELLTAAQALDFRHPLRPGRGVEVAHEHVRSLVTHRDADRSFHEEVAQGLAMMRDGTLLHHVEQALEPLA